MHFKSNCAIFMHNNLRTMLPTVKAIHNAVAEQHGLWGVGKRRGATEETNSMQRTSKQGHTAH
jgi:hypothetical protein